LARARRRDDYHGERNAGRRYPPLSEHAPNAQALAHRAGATTRTGAHRNL